MPSDTSLPSTPDDSPSSRASGWLTGLAIAGIAVAYLLISPDPAAESMRPWDESSWPAWLMLRMVRIQALGYLYPTPRGVEIKDIAFHVIACVLTLIVAILWLCGRAPRALPRTWSDAWRSPSTCFAAAVVISALSAAMCSAPAIAAGGTAIRFLWFAWWWPLAVLLTPRDVRRVVAGMIAAAALAAVIGLAYRQVRAAGQPLAYPMGNPLFLAACLLPAGVIAGGLAVGGLWPMVAGVRLSNGGSTTRRDAAAKLPQHAPVNGATKRNLISSMLAAVCACLIAWACLKTGSRSAWMGFGFGLIAIVYLAADREVRTWLVVAAAVVIGLTAGYLVLFGGDLSRTVVALMDALSGRTASIRARVEHEWPIAAQLFAGHPILGAGEGGFARLVGPLVRAAQYDDPALLRADGWSWETHAHNEILETLTSLGLLGAAAMLLAVWWTWRAAIQAVDAADKHARVWIIALAGGFVAMCGEELTDIALHKPGLPAIAMTTWACLWVMVRSRAAPPEHADVAAAECNTGRHYAGGALAAAALVALGFAMLNAISLRAEFEAQRQAAATDTGERLGAITLADSAARWRLAPDTRLNAMVLAIQTRVAAAQAMATANAGDPRLVEPCTQALTRVQEVHAAAPRYLRAYELEGVAATLLAQARHSRGENDSAALFAEQARRAFRDNRNDEPFRLDALRWLWQADADATPADRATWLRDMLRGGEIEPGWESLLVSLGPAANDAINTLLAAANQDIAAASPAVWRDRLSPEIFRVAARAAFLQSNSALASALIRNAVTLYASVAGSRPGLHLGVAQGAALHEQVQYAFDQFGLGLTADAQIRLLDLLESAHRARFGASSAGRMSGGIGRTQVRLLLFSGREHDARPTCEQLASEGVAASAEAAAAQAYVALVEQFGGRADTGALQRVMGWSRQAAVLAPQLPAAHWCVAVTALRMGRDDDAGSAIASYREIATDKSAADVQIARLRTEFPKCSLWSGATSAPATEPASPRENN